MIDITQYRSRIGLFSQKVYGKKFLSNPKKSRDIAVLSTKFIFQLTLLCILTSSVWLPLHLDLTNCCWPHSYTMVTTTATTGTGYCWLLGTGRGGMQVISTVGMERGNFWAKYVNGNRREIKGVHNMHFNIRSLKFKVSEVKNIVKRDKPHIFGLSECELKKENFDSKILKVPGYDILYPKSWDAHGFARVVVYVKKTFSYQQVHDLEDDIVQSIWLKGAFKNSKQLYFCHAYREHSSTMGGTINNQKEYLSKFLSQWETATEHDFPSEPNEVHISLDMNLDYLPDKWLQQTYRLYSLTKLVQNTCNAYNFSQLVTEPTRTMYNSVTNTTGISCIDHVYCNYKYKCSTPTIIVSGTSDHDIVSYRRFSKAPPTPARTIRRRSYKTFVEKDFLADLTAVDWSEVYAARDVDDAVDIFTEKFRFILNQHAPWIIFQLRKNFCPWLTDKTKELMSQRDAWKAKAKELAVANPGEVSEEQAFAWGEYKKLRNKINNVKVSEEVNFKREKIEENKNDSAKVWKCTKTFMNWKSTGTPSQIESSNRLVTSAREIAELMNEFFIDKVKLIRAGMAKVVTNMASCIQIMADKRCKLSMSHITVDKVRKLLSTLSNSRSVAVDELDNYSVKIAAPVIAGPLHHIITLSIMQEKFPKNWKSAKVLPLHKKLSPLEKKNYRPVAILSPLSKVLEKFVYEQLYNYFTVNHILHPNLHGYRKNRSTQTALLQMYDRWVQAAAQGQVSGAVLLDLSAAFDLVPPDILLKKLEIYGIERDFLAWIKSYLSDRCQAVWIDHVMSDFLPCDVGVPQGSNLGPLFFMLFVNDLPFILTCDIDQYADDSTLTATGKTIADINEVLETNCDVVSNWMSENMLQLNADKTHILTLGTRERLAIPGNNVTVSMDGIVLEEDPEHSETLLGVTIDANLKWHGQINNLLGKLRKRLAGLAHVKFVLPYNLRKVISEGLFNSVLGYCLPVFGSCDSGEIQDIQILQNKAAQLVTHSPPRAIRNPMYDRLGWLTVNQLVRYHTLLAVYRIRLTGEPEYLAASLCNDNRMRNIIVQNTKLTLAKKSFKLRGASNWNALPANIRNLQTIGAFKKSVKIWIMQHVPRFLD